MKRISSVPALSTLLTLASLLAACNKTPSTTEASALASSSAAAALPAAAPATPVASATPAPAATPLTGLDSCLVGSWKSTGFSMKTDQVTAEGGANLAMKVAANGDAVVDFGPMAPINGKGAGASFDFQYSGKATATLTTPTRGAIASSKPDYAALRVTATVQLPGAGKMNLFKAKPVSELAQMASAVASAKAPAPAAGAPPPGIDSAPIFSTTHYTCEADTLSLDSSDKLAAKWLFSRVSH